MGNPDKTLLDTDNLYHLSDRGASRLAINIKTIIHSPLGLELAKQFTNTARKPGLHRSSLNFPFLFIPPGYFLSQG